MSDTTKIIIIVVCLLSVLISFVQFIRFRQVIRQNENETVESFKKKLNGYLLVSAFIAVVLIIVTIIALTSK